MRKTTRPHLLVAGFALTLACCTAPEEPAPSPAERPDSERRFLGRWTELPPEGLLRFAGQDLTFDLETDSLRILDDQFTDAAGCEIRADSTRHCSDFRWTNTFRGTWSTTDSTLVLDFHFVHTTASPPTRNHLPVHSGRAEFKPSLEGSILVLTRVGGEFISPKPKIRLQPVFECWPTPK